MTVSASEVVKKILKEPLVHFIVLGAMLFGVYGWVSGPTGGARGEIVITQGQIEHLAAGFARAWQRPPSPDELAGLIRDRVREEVLYREAMAMGLDKDDAVVRRRLRQKLEFISDDLAAQAEPTDTELQAYLQAHPDAFRTEPHFSFRHVYLSPQKRGQNLQRDARQLLTQLNKIGAKADTSQFGDVFLLEQQFEKVSGSEVTKLFGTTFAAQLPKLVLRQWQGPIESGYGAHLVYVRDRTEGRLPELAQVRGVVQREWANARRLEANEKFYQALLARYTVTIEETKPVNAKEPVNRQ